jgi:hypothetical protein
MIEGITLLVKLITDGSKYSKKIDNLLGWLLEKNQ